MSRFKRAIHGVASSYVLLAVTAVYSLASVPVALHYLDTERFGLWALMSTLMGYLALVDAGISGSAARLIIDHKDHRDGGNYGSFLKTVLLVTIIQGFIILLIGFCCAGLFGNLLAIPLPLKPEFNHLVHLQCTAVAVTFGTRIFALILSGYQRMDLVNYAGILSLAVNFATLWICFHFGVGVISLAWASLTAAIVVVVCQWISCGRLGFFPEKGRWGTASWEHFSGIFSFGKDLFLVTVGSQLIMASQTIVITRMLGLEAAAAWSVGLRMFNLVAQFIWRILDMSGSAFAEMMVRDEKDRLRDRFRAAVTLTASLGSFAAVSFALCNSLFIPIWTHNKLAWHASNDALLAIWLVILSISRCYSGLLLLTKKVGLMRYVYFAEGTVFVCLSLLVVKWGGLAAVICCSILCTTIFSGTYSLQRVSRYLNLSPYEVGVAWLHPMLRMLLYYLPSASLSWWLVLGLPETVRLGVNIVVACVVGLYLLLRYGMPRSFQIELLTRTPRFAVQILSRIFPAPIR